MDNWLLNMLPDIKVSDYKAAYKSGVNGGFVGYCTPALIAAQDMGRNGIVIDWDNIVTGYRYGNIPEGGVSRNYADDCMELGCSLARLEGGKEVGSSVWFCDRPEVKVRGILLPVKGSDGEPLVLPLDIKCMD